MIFQSELMKQTMKLVIPINSRDFEKIKNICKFYKKYIKGINCLVLIGNEKIKHLIKENKYIFNMKFKFINEKSLLDIDKIKKLIVNKNKKAIGRSGWYIQQFLKMEYSNLCKEKYYLVWDSDTIPVKEIKMFNNEGKPYFDVKTEYHKPYFATMKKLIPELGKKYNYSFISEHMLIKTEIMKNLINLIDKNLNIPGDKWYEKIINSININELKKSGFSEFETYGTFVNVYYNHIYEIRHWKSLRKGKLYYKFKSFTFLDAQNISKNFDAISFEK